MKAKQDMIMGQSIGGGYFQNAKVLSKGLPVGTALYDTGGYATAFTNFITKKGTWGISPAGKLQCVGSNSIQLLESASKIQHGIQLTLDSQIGELSSDQTYFIYGGDVGLTYKNPVKISISQLKAGFVYATFSGDAYGSPDSKLTVTLNGDTLTFTTSAVDTAGTFKIFSHNSGTAYMYNNGSLLSVLIDSITAY